MSAQADLFEAKSPVEPARIQGGRKPKKRGKLKGAVARPLKVQFLTIEEVKKRYGVSQATVWRWVKGNEHFPEPVKLSPGTSRWSECQLIEFENRVQARQFSRGPRTSKKVSP